MMLNRKSAKKTSKISLLVAVVMLTTVFTVFQTQGYPVEGLAENGINLCKAGVADFLTVLFW